MPNWHGNEDLALERLVRAAQTCSLRFFLKQSRVEFLHLGDVLSEKYSMRRGVDSNMLFGLYRFSL